MKNPKSVRYNPNHFPPETRMNWPELVPQLGPAWSALARFDEALSRIPNPDLLLSLMGTREAVLSSRIEGIQTTVSEVAKLELGRGSHALQVRESTRETLNCRQAMAHAIVRMSDLPLSQRIVKESHAILMNSAGGRAKAPGEYRRTPVWIGSRGSSREDAHYIPIEANQIDTAMGRWEKYVHEESTDKIVQLAAIHAEFEAIHPFLDGNGRTGRLLIPLFLWMSGLTRLPVFYMSAYFEANRDAYYEGLLSVSLGDWTRWCRLFLSAVAKQAESSYRVVSNLLVLHEEVGKLVNQVTRSPFGSRSIDWIFRYPVFSGSEFVSGLQVTRSSALRLLNSLIENGVLDVVAEGRGRRATEYAFTKLLTIVEH